MERAAGKSEFDISRSLSKRSFHLSSGMLLSLLIVNAATLFIRSDNARLAVVLLFGMLAAVFFILKLLEMRGSSKLVIDGGKLLYESEEMLPEDLESTKFKLEIVEKREIR